EAGMLGEVLAAEGATVQVGDLLATLTPGAGAAKPAAKPAAAAKAPDTAAPAPAAAGQPAATQAGSAAGQALPAAAKLAAEKGVDVSGVSGSGKGGRVTKGDVMDLLAGGGKPAAKPAVPAGPRANADREERQRMSKLRQVIARRLKEA